VVPLFVYYLQPAVGGRVLTHRFWREFCELDRVVGIKIAPFNRYQTLDVVRAVAESGRDDIALYTGNDDNILMDLVTPFSFQVEGRTVERWIVGGLLGQWAVWTHSAVKMLDECRRIRHERRAIPVSLMRLAAELTDANAAIFDAANGFAGCIAGVHEVLRRQGLLDGVWLLDENETLSAGQSEEIDRVCRAYPHLTDDAFVAASCEHWAA
jgi:CheY-like chemotaxis protein